MRSAALACLLLAAGCDSYDPVTFTVDGEVLIVRGVIDESTPDALRAALEESPSATTLRLVSVPGSVDDETSLVKLTRIIRERELDTVVPANGSVASGGTDMALMGVRRIIEPGACIGVHSWGAEDSAGTDFPPGDSEHQLYLDFYRQVGVPEAFYWFTLEAAGPEAIHWMSEEEINRFGLSSAPVTGTGDEPVSARNARCDLR